MIVELGNCLELLDNIPTGTVDAIIADPPYFQGLTFNGSRGVFTDLNLCRPFFTEFFQISKRVIKPDTGCIYFFCDWRGMAFYMPLMEAAIGIRNCLVWHKMSGAGSFYTYEHEMILFWTNNNRFQKKGARNVITGIPGFACGARKCNGPKVHPTQKPVELIEKLITDSTPDGGLVLDPFMGSGTTGVACVRTGRDFVGFEIQEKYYIIARDRIDDALAAQASS